MSGNGLIWPDYDDIGYEFWREAQLAAAEEPPAVLRLVPPLPPACTPLVRCEVCRSVMARCFCPFVVAEGLRRAS
jgi:hypothetical protein